MRGLYIILLTLLSHYAFAQQGFAFTHITTDDGLGLASNVVTSLHQDEKGFLWVGTANGLQRFDGSKFIQFNTKKKGSEALPHSTVSQIIPADSGSLLLSMPSLREFGIFNPSTFTFKKIPLKTAAELPPRAEFWLWKSSAGDIFCNVLGYGILKYHKKSNEFVDDYSFKIPKGWVLSVTAVYEDTIKNQFWFGGIDGLCIHDKSSNTTYTKNYNPKQIPILNNKLTQDRVTQVFIDNKRRIWIFAWPSWGNGGQYKFCFDSTGTTFLDKDTLGLNPAFAGYTEFNRPFQTRQGDLWIYGLGVLFNYDENTKQFIFNRSSPDNNNSINITYESVFDMVEDKDGSLWIATDKGLYYTAYGSGMFSVVNLLFNKQKEELSITDILELPNGDLWFTSWGTGVKVLDKFLQKKDHDIYRQPPPASWSPAYKNNTRLTWTMCRENATGNIWIGCNGGVLVVHNPQKKTTVYLNDEVFNKSTIRFIVEDTKGNLWFGTQGGRLIKWRDNQFTLVKEVGTIIYKIFFDKDGIIWLAAHEKGLYAVDPTNGNTLQQYTSGPGENKLYSNTGNDIEQLNDSIIVFGAGALHFINKRNGTVSQLDYANGLPSNTVRRVRMDTKGYLWIVTSSGLCMYSPNNKRITPYGRKDGIILAEQTLSADYFSMNGNLIFAGSNAVLLFDPKTFINTQAPPNVAITDFKIFNDYHPVDSIMQLQALKLKPSQNGISIYFSSLSYRHRDKLTYYYKMEGLDKEWIKADASLYVNYPLLPPGNYTFKVYCENLEGVRSKETTQINIIVKPPFWRTWWFYSSILFTMLLLIYAIHDLRVNRLLAVEKLRNRVARDLHDDMGSTLSTINILSSMAKTKMATDTVKTAEFLSKISDNSQRMMDAMDDIVWSIKPSNDSMQKITARMREFATNVLEAKDIEMHFEIDEQVHDVKLNMEARRDFFLIFKETVNNAAKYSKASIVNIQVALQQKKILLVVKDDGIGFNVKEADSGNGLGNIQKRADAMNAKLDMRSKPGVGTTVSLLVPVG